MASFDTDLFEFFIKLMEEGDLRSPLELELKGVLMTVAFLNVFHSCQAMFHHVEEDGTLKFLRTRIYRATLNANAELRRLAADINQLCPDLNPWRARQMPMNMDELISGMLERLWIMRCDIQKLYAILISSSSRSVSYLNYEDAVKVLDSLGIFTKKDKARWFEEPIQLRAFRNALKLLRNFIGFTAERCRYKIGNLKDLLIHAESVVEKVSCLLYLHSVNPEKMDDQTRLQLSSEILKIIPAQAEVKDIYIKALKASESELGTFQWSHLDSFFKHALKLSATLRLPLYNQEPLYYEVRFLSELLYESFEKDQMGNHFPKPLTAVIISTIRVIICYFNNDEQNGDADFNFRMAVYDMHQYFMLRRQNTSEADCIYLQRPWRFLGPNRWQDIFSQLDFMKEVPQKKICSQIKMAREELEALAAGGLTAFQRNLPEEIHRRHLVHIADYANYVITSFNYGILSLWSSKLELYNVIQKIRLINIGHSRNIYTGAADIFEDHEQLSYTGKRMPTLAIVGMLELEDQLECLGTYMNLRSPLKDEVRILRLKASFLRVFLRCKGKWHIENANFKVSLTRIQNFFQNATFRKMWADVIQIKSKGCGGIPMTMEHTLSSLQEGLQLLYPDIQQVYYRLSKCSRYITCMTDEAVTDNLHCLLENIEELLGFNVELVSPVKGELEAVERTLRFFIDLICFTAKRCNRVGTLKDLLVLAEMLVDNVSCLLYLCCIGDKRTHQMTKEIQMQLSAELQRFSPAEQIAREIYIKSLNASKPTHKDSLLVDEFWCFIESFRDYILVFSNNMISSSTSTSEQILLLYEDLPFLITYFAMDLSLDEHVANDHRIFMDILELTSAIIIEIEHVTSSLHNDEKIDIHKKFSDFLYDIYFPRSFRYNFPKTNGKGFISTLMGNLNQLLSSRANLVAPLKYHIEMVLEMLQSAREDFNKMEGQPIQCQELQTQWSRLIDSSYHIEYVIDSFFVGHGTLSCHKLVLLNILEEIRTIKMELNAIKHKITGDKAVKSSSFPSHFSMAVVPSSKQPLAKEKGIAELVIFPEAKDEIIGHLTYGSRNLNFLSIVGMPGIGKTTLANSVFQHSSVTSHFHVRARCCISQVYDKRRLFLAILEQVKGESIECKDVYDLEKKLYECLKGRRYLIFMDDIWSVQPWKEIRNSFPNDENGSRIMFTTRFDYIASHVGPDSINCPLSPLSPDKSWMMLEWEIFGDRGCPTNALLKLGYEIAANCKGIPLAVNLTAGLLRGKEINIKEWKKVADSMKDYLQDPQGLCQKVIELSYLDLPEELRPCFLYFATFPEDINIPTRVLTLVWIAEGFVQLQKNDQRCLEDVAEVILNNLIDRSLIIVSERGILGEIVATHIHDLLHNFASDKAREERFMSKIDGSTLPCDGYRISIIPDNWDNFVGSYSSGITARSLNYYGDALSSSWQLSYFKLLRVLNIPGITCDPYPTIFTLIHLKFLAISIPSCIISSLIRKLRNLESFFLYNSVLPSIHLPVYEVRGVSSLRHIACQSPIYLWGCRRKIREKPFQFRNLRTLLNVRVSYASDIEKIFKLMPSLVSLKVEFFNPDGGFYPFPKLDFLEKLESLEVAHDCMEYPCKIINFPPHLTTLAVSNFCLPWTEISELGIFENLLILKLLRSAFKGAIWNMNDGQFPNLKYLCLKNLDIEEWNATEDNFSCLEQLEVISCKKLKELPCYLAEVITLQKIKLYRCRNSVEISAKIVKEEQEASGNDQFVLEAEDTFVNEDSKEELDEMALDILKGFEKLKMSLIYG